MYSVSNEWKQKIYEEVNSITNVYFDNTLINPDYIFDLRVGGDLFDEEFALGNTPSRYMEIRVHKSQIVSNINKVKLEYGIEIDGEYEIIPIGIYNIDDISENDDDTVTMKLQDNMIKFEFNYDGSVLINQNSTASLLEILQDICIKAGVELRFYFFFGF